MRGPRPARLRTLPTIPTDSTKRCERAHLKPDAPEPAVGIHALEVSRASGAVSGSSHPVFVRCHLRRARVRLLHGADGGRPGEAHAPLGRSGVDLPRDAGVTRIQRPARTAFRPRGRRVGPGRLRGLTLAAGPGTSARTLPGSLHAVPHPGDDEHRGSDQPCSSGRTLPSDPIPSSTASSPGSPSPGSRLRTSGWA